MSLLFLLAVFYNDDEDVSHNHPPEYNMPNNGDDSLDDDSYSEDDGHINDTWTNCNREFHFTRLPGYLKF
ncbi:unnamed protein product [Arabidopsis halleri]